MHILMSYIVIFIFVLFLMKANQKVKYKNHPKQILIFAALYIFFVVVTNQYSLANISLLEWLNLTIILYIVLDDILHREFNLLAALFVIIVNFFTKENLYLPILIGVIVFVTGFIWLIEKLINKESDDKTNVIGGMSIGDPWLIVAFVSFLNVEMWIKYFICIWIIIVVAFIIQIIRKKQKEGIPLAPILFLGGIILMM